MVEVEHGGVLQAPGLRGDRVHDVRVAVAAAHGGDAGEGVQVAPAALVVQVLPLPLNDVQLQAPHKHNTPKLLLVAVMGFSYTQPFSLIFLWYNISDPV